jgi:hypothetical protein
MTTASFNYLQRRKIKRTKNFDVRREESQTSDLMVSVKLHKSLLNFIEQEEVVRLEASARGTYFAVDLEKSEKEQKFEISGVNKKDSPSFRVYSVFNADRSKIRRASADFKLNSGRSKPSRKRPVKKKVPAIRHGFFSFVYADIGPRIHQIRWDAGLEIVVSERLQYILEDEIQKNASFRASFLPSLVKEILLGIILRNENLDDLGEKEGNWMHWANELNLFCDDDEAPDIYFKEADGNISQEWLDWCDTCYSNFCSGLHFDGSTYLDAMVKKHEN